MRNEMIKHKKIIVSIFIVLIICILVILATPYIGKIYLLRKLGDYTAYNLVPKGIKELPLIDKLYLETLKKYDFETISISIPSEYDFIRKSKGNIVFRKVKGGKKIGLIYINQLDIISLLDSNPELEVSCRKMEITTNHEFYKKILYLSKDNFSRKEHLVFLVYKKFILSTISDRSDLYEYKQGGFKGFFASWGDESNARYNFWIFDDKDNAFEMTFLEIGLRDSLKKVSTILSTLKFDKTMENNAENLPKIGLDRKIQK
jgi:hypothetical protein